MAVIKDFQAQVVDLNTMLPIQVRDANCMLYARAQHSSVISKHYLQHITQNRGTLY